MDNEKFTDANNKEILKRAVAGLGDRTTAVILLYLDDEGLGVYMFGNIITIISLLTMYLNIIFNKSKFSFEEKMQCVCRYFKAVDVMDIKRTKDLN